MSLYLDNPAYVDPASLLVNFAETYFAQYNFDSEFACQVQDKESDSGYASTSTARDNFRVDF
jgi:hypothetical protein